MEKNIDYYADLMLQKIKVYLQDEIKKTNKYEAAIIESVNQDNTVNVYIPPDNKQVFTKISNQTPFKLQKGDSVELLLKNGNYSNCWVAAKHQSSYEDQIKLLQSEIESLKERVKILENQNNV